MTHSKSCPVDRHPVCVIDVINRTASEIRSETFHLLYIRFGTETNVVTLKKCYFKVL